MFFNHNFSLGEEVVDYTSDYQSGFASTPKTDVDKAGEKKKLKALRRAASSVASGGGGAGAELGVREGRPGGRAPEG